ncbi:S-adenosyl-L-methionine-dependent methyltransferase [Trematosphaeria pertusa]|uniref:Trimethylguanosine synthase n=1 Tax=Trematosphaeria pertusa TaxID=390896 RepID=A0A6A6IT10_9PLEO|nr:S-adenosyl-L-methionine-dependent methyltransferase [Trematosphaeria pertusa]KAF2252673.1 S-adenosyl-L-methionine-dependent methyltransferase [Trematosphaeria pertusa]
MDEEPNEKGIHQWLDVDEFPEHLKKYWHQRFKIWQDYNKGIWMTEDGWFGVTPEPIANKIAAHLAESAPKDKTIIIDAFAGVGGNSIAFARSERWEQVFAIEKDTKAMKCAKHNAKVYGVDKKIVWVTGDCFDVISRRFSGKTNVIIFASPPWGGTEYSAEDVFDLTKMEPYNLNKLVQSFSMHSKHIVLYLPRTSDLNQIARYAPEGKKLEVTHYCMMGASKALCVYFGDFNFDVDETEEKSPA